MRVVGYTRAARPLPKGYVVVLLASRCRGARGERGKYQRLRLLLCDSTGLVPCGGCIVDTISIAVDAPLGKRPRLDVGNEEETET